MHIKPTSNYRMSKATKTMLAGIIDPQLRGDVKRAMVQADLQSMQGAPRGRDKSSNAGPN